MGTTITLLMPASQADKGLRLVQNLFEEWEHCLSRFSQDSELTRLNELAGTGLAMPVSNLFYKVLSTALTAARASDGIYDPALLDQLIQAGYDRTFEQLPVERFDPIIPGEPGGRWRGIRIDPIRRRVSLPEGVRLDFGGIAKGMAVDAALELLHSQGIKQMLVNAGGDLAVQGLPSGEESWAIAVPGREGNWTIPLQQGAIATSGIARRHWWKAQTLQHHLLDPRTGQPADSDLWSVTVAADRCEQAEIAAKVAFILGSKNGADFLRQHRIAGLLVRADGTWEAVHPWPIEYMENER